MLAETINVAVSSMFALFLLSKKETLSSRICEHLLLYILPFLKGWKSTQAFPLPWLELYS